VVVVGHGVPDLKTNVHSWRTSRKLSADGAVIVERRSG
jgi:hypothetical protein